MASGDITITITDIFPFKLHDVVFIKVVSNSQLRGIIKGILINDEGVSYLVRYFISGDPKEAYFYADELERFKC